MWFWLSLSAAILGGVENVIAKKILDKVGTAVFTWGLFALSLPVFGFLAFKDGLPSLNQVFFVGTVGSSLAFTISKTMTNHAIKKGVLSKLLPLSTFNVLFTYILGLIFLSEQISLGAIMGLLLIVFGGYILNAEGAQSDLLKPNN